MLLHLGMEKQQRSRFSLCWGKMRAKHRERDSGISVANWDTRQFGCSPQGVLLLNQLKSLGIATAGDTMPFILLLGRFERRSFVRCWMRR